MRLPQQQYVTGMFYKIPTNPNYSITTEGVVRSNRSGRILKQQPNIYKMVSLSLDGKKTCRTVHSLVAETFLELVRGTDKVVDHISGDKHDNRLLNLMVVDAGYNSRNRVRTNCKSQYRGVTRNRNQWVSQITFKGKQTILYRGDSEQRARDCYLNFRAMMHKNRY